MRSCVENIAAGTVLRRIGQAGSIPLRIVKFPHLGSHLVPILTIANSG
jgi:hypothetical protein